MTVDRHELYMPARGGWSAQSGFKRWLREFAPHDWLVIGYLAFLNVAVLTAPPSHKRPECMAAIFLLFACYTAIAGLVRARVFTHPVVAPFMYRLAALGCVEATYFLFADLLPIVNHHSLDHQLYHLDLALFGVEPAMFFDRFVTHSTTEWFAFFYYGYFFVLAMHVLPILFLSRRPRLLGHFGLGMLLVFCIGHSLYLFVPGYGPHRAMPEAFTHSLPPGVWWSMTTDLVARSGAQKDIFPSLHTAAPTFILLFSFHHRREYPFRFSWPIVAFFVVNIITATMFLRWHYVIDVVAGLLLALTAHAVSLRVTRREQARRSALRLTPLWPEWFAPVPATPEKQAEAGVPLPGE